MDPWFVLLFFALMGAFGWYLAGRGRRQRTTSPAWHRVARRFGGTVAPEHGDALTRSARQHALQVKVEGVGVTADLANLTTDRDVEVLTAIQAKVAGEPDFELQVEPRDLATDLDRILGGEHAGTGDDAFDRAFHVRSPNAKLVPLWVDGPVRRAITASTGYSFSIAAGLVDARLIGRDDDERRLAAAIAAVARLANRGEALQRKWRRLAQQLGGAVDERQGLLPAIDIDAEGVPVAVSIDDAPSATDGMRTCLTATPLSRQRERFALARSIPDWAASLEPMPRNAVPLPGRSAVSAAPAQTLTWLEPANETLRSIDPAGITYDGELLSLWFDEITMDAARIRRAVSLVATLGSRDEQGPYR